MRQLTSTFAVVTLACQLVAGISFGQIYFNNENMTVMLGPSMEAEPFQNRSTADSLASVIDMPNADAIDPHNQSTHVWVSGAPLELDFALEAEYTLSTFHFWNYSSNAWDVDNIDLTFFDGSQNQVGDVLHIVDPALGGTSESEIKAQHIPLELPGSVQYINAMLTGSNGQIDFQNIGFTGASGTDFALCDYDNSGACDGQDIDQLTLAIVGGDVAFDLTGDGALGITDQLQWLSLAGAKHNASGQPYLVGDTDLNGMVNSTDLGLLLNNFGATEANVAYTHGDLNADSMVDSVDLGLLLNNFDKSSASTASVPEPGALVHLAFSMLVLWGWRQR